MEMVLKETLRLYPTAVGTGRENMEDIQFEGYRIPAHSFLVVSRLYMCFDICLQTDKLKFLRQHGSDLDNLPISAIIIISHFIVYTNN